MCEDCAVTDREFDRKLSAIQSDRSSGAAELARKSLEIVSQSCLQDHSESTAELLHELNRQADLLARSRPSMVPIANLLHAFCRRIREFSQDAPAEARKNCAAVAGSIITASLEASGRTAAQAAALIGPDRTVFSHSYSSTVLQAFTLLREKGLKVIITESRPLNEGHGLAAKLSALEIPTTLITDAQTGLFISKADMVLVGADAILPDFTAVNKAGTYLAALAAHDNNIPFYVCAESYKRLFPGAGNIEPEAMAAAELNAPEIPNVKIKNIYFDRTPARLITGWINEDGVRHADMV